MATVTITISDDIDGNIDFLADFGSEGFDEKSRAHVTAMELVDGVRADAELDGRLTDLSVEGLPQ